MDLSLARRQRCGSTRQAQSRRPRTNGGQPSSWNVSYQLVLSANSMCCVPFLIPGSSVFSDAPTDPAGYLRSIGSAPYRTGTPLIAHSAPIPMPAKVSSHQLVVERSRRRTTCRSGSGRRRVLFERDLHQLHFCGENAVITLKHAANRTPSPVGSSRQRPAVDRQLANRRRDPRRT